MGKVILGDIAMRRSIQRTLLLTAAFLLGAGPMSYGKVIYVDDDAVVPGDGKSWATAYRFLQDALADANDSDGPVEICVAQGTYKPDRSSAQPTGTGNRAASFHLLNNAAIRGGFAGIGTPDPNVQNIALYETVFSGDLAGDDASVRDAHDLLTEPTRAENSYTVLSAGPCSRAAVVDGFIICSGNAIGPERHQLDQKGAGLLLSHYGTDCCPSIRNCTFRNNCAYYGGAAYVIGASPELIECKFLQNAAVEGGAMGTSAWRGGPSELWHGSPCEFVIDGCMFADNYAQNGGGAINIGAIGAEAPFRIEDSRFTRNFARTGGALYSTGRASITNCGIVHNVADEAGGAIYFGGTKLSIVSCTLAGNMAPSGRAMACLEPLRKGLAAPSATVTNTILWNGGDEIAISEHVQMNVTYSDIHGHWPGIGNIDVTPLFADPGYWDPNGTPDDPNDDFFVEGDYHLKSQAGRWGEASRSWVQDEVTSPCIDAGDPNSPIMYEPFPNGGVTNMGAYGGTAEASKSYFGAPLCETIIAGDINGDCRVDIADILILLDHWLQDHRSQALANED